MGKNEDRGPGPLPSSPPPTPGPGRAGSPRAVRAAAPREGSPGPGWSSQPRSYRLHRGWVAAPRSTWGPGVGRGPPTSTPTRTPAGAVRSQELGPTWSESEITLFNYTIPEPTSAIGAFELAN